MQLIGYIGTIISAVAYLPQIIHLIKEKCSAGISLRTYSLWLISSACILLYAATIQAYLIVIMQSVNLMAVIIILIFARKYEGMVCETHKINPATQE